MDKFTVLNKQLQQTCKLNGARWAAWLKSIDEGWSIELEYGVSKARHSTLMQFIHNPRTEKWLSGALSSGRTRSRKISQLDRSLGCERIDLIPNFSTRSAILVGADQLSSEGLGFFRVIAQSDSIEPVSPNIPFFEQSFASIQEIGGEASYDPKAAFNWALDILRNAVNCDAAFIAIRVGDIFRVETSWNYSDFANGFEISIEHERILSEMILTRQSCILLDIQKPLDFVIGAGLQNPVRSCLIAPIALGRRVIGLFVCVSQQSKGFITSDLN